MLPQYRRVGEGPPLVYVSGVEGTGKLFYRQEEDLARDHTVISFAMRGEGRYGMDALVADLAAIVRDAGFERATFLGESFGGMLVMASALEHPSMFERLILVNTFPYFKQRAKIRAGVALFTVLPYSLMKAHRTRAARHVLFSPDVGDEDRRLFREHTRVVPYEGYVSRMRIIRDTDLRPRLAEIKAPALVVAGTADRLLDSVWAAKILGESLPRARVKLLEGTGHTALLSGRVRVRDWLAELEEI
ncbi:MAG TPA: alpha/beta fold hydrolase [Pyrinomonadaceae bacterium]|nr:alpha/beta fold hydrolase [Pyrinomonadaceae bacterium]